jgi:sugar transferase (PEP-CTERM system associated)
MVRLFHVYYPLRTLVLLACEALIICASFLAATLLRLGSDSYLVLNYENGVSKILVVTAVVILASHYFDLYAPAQVDSRAETYFRLLLVLGILCFFLAAVTFVYPRFEIQRGVYLTGTVLLTGSLMSWRAMFGWIIRLPQFRERVYVIGAGERAENLVQMIRQRTDMGMEIVGWAGAAGDTALDRDLIGKNLRVLAQKGAVDRVVVAITDRRGTMPIRELLDLRLGGVKIEEANSIFEKMTGKLETEGLYPSALIYSEGFRVSTGFVIARRILSIVISLTGLLLCLPIIPILAIGIRLTSPGPIFFRQNRVGRKGKIFSVYKFRTMRADAEAKTGAVWAGRNDPRVTTLGRYMRKTRLDEIPQLWNVLKGDMAFVGPRPERPEFVQWLEEQIPYYNMRHIIRPGLTGWAQVKYQYGASLEETKQKLQYDLYYIKHMSVALDLWIMFETIKTVILRRGAQ